MAKIVLINGKKRAGKDFTASLIKEELISQGYTVELMSFAAPIKKIISDTFDISLTQLDDFKNNGDMLYEGNDKLEISFRSILQRFANDAMKPIFGEAVWADIVYADAVKSKADFILVPDFRFKVELKDYIFRTLLINNTSVDMGDLHSSETELNDFEFDDVLDNTNYILTKLDIEQYVMSLIQE
jgi:hypothetical protein